MRPSVPSHLWDIQEGDLGTPDVSLFAHFLLGWSDFKWRRFCPVQGTSLAANILYTECLHRISGLNIQWPSGFWLDHLFPIGIPISHRLFSLIPEIIQPVLRTNLWVSTKVWKYRGQAVLRTARAIWQSECFSYRLSNNHSCFQLCCHSQCIIT